MSGCICANLAGIRHDWPPHGQGPSCRNIRPRGALVGAPAFPDGFAVLQADELPAGPSDRFVPESEPSSLLDAGMICGNGMD